jgi:hypothetical protein
VPQTPGVNNDDLVAAHIHAGPTTIPTAPVVWGFIGAPFHNNAPNDLVITPFSGPGGFGATVSATWNASEGVGTLAGQLPNLLAGNSYLNFHTVQNPGGEIRGQLQAVPEPSTLALGGIGLASLVGYRWRRRKQGA